MAIFSPSESPSIVVKEVDLTGGVPNVQSTTGAIVGDYRWGPVRQATLVDTEAGLASTFGSPTATNAVDFYSAVQFLRYSSSLYVVREVTSAAKNAVSNSSSLAETVLVRNKDHYDTLSFGMDTADTQTGLWIAKYPGTLGNSLKVSICAPDGFGGWGYASEFDRAPSSSPYAVDRGGQNDEVHVVVIDEDGDITGTPGTVLERFAHLSVASDAKTTDGSSNYVKDVVNSRSRWIWFGTWEEDADSDGTSEVSSFTNAGSAAANTTFNASASAAVTTSLAGGVNSGSLTTSEYATGLDLFDDKDTIQVDFLIAPGMSELGEQVTVVNDFHATARTLRKDCVVVASPHRSAVVNNASPNADIVTWANQGPLTRDSYLVVDNNYLKVYDKYNDQYIYIPAASSTAGIMAASDASAAPWFSPAGPRRGQYLGVTQLAYSPTKTERDTLYKAGVNPISNIPGQGVLLFGDKTFMNRPSAFDRINVRRLFLVIERAISLAARNVMFEFNDEFTRAEFVNVVEPFLREIQGRRGITDFRVVCDETNNTAAVVDRNEFIANIFIKPARSINYITLNFVAVRTGVDFEEVVGQV